jgi:hypothetical protein
MMCEAYAMRGTPCASTVTDGSTYCHFHAKADPVRKSKWRTMRSRSLATVLALLAAVAFLARPDTAGAAIGCPVPKPGEVTCQGGELAWLPASWREYARIIQGGTWTP